VLSAASSELLSSQPLARHHKLPRLNPPQKRENTGSVEREA